jgi:predicted dienelactone hydrolase
VSQADTAIALAEAGFVVAAPTHPGDNLKDDSDVGHPEWLVDRSRHVTKTIDALLTAWKDRSHVDPKHIGIFGLSAGATTALVEIGAKPDLSLVPSQCASHPEFVCKILPLASYRHLSPIIWTADPRISAAVIAAPGLGFTFEPNGLADVRAPVQLWAGSADQTVPYATNTGVVRQLLPHPPEVHIAPGAVHLSFLMPCGLIGPPQFCRDANGFDRETFHKSFNQDVVRFFREHL